MRLKPNLPPTDYNTPRGRGPLSIPNTMGGGPIDYTDPLASKPATSCFWDKASVLAHPGLEFSPGKIFLGRVDQKMMGLADTRHIVTLAGSGGGKTACVLIPNLRLYQGSALVIDPKGELARNTARQRRAMGQEVHVIDPWGVAFKDGDDGSAALPDDFRSSLDPLHELGEDAENLTDNAELIAAALIMGNEKDPFWTDAARGLVRALILWSFIDLEEKGAGLGDLPGLIAEVAASFNLKDEDETGLLQRWLKFNPDDGATDAVLHQQATYLLALDERPRSSIIATAKTQLQFLESPSLGRALSSSALVLADLKRRPSTVYLCLPAARMKTHSRWLRLVINLALAAVERVPADLTRPPVLFMLEEFAALRTMETLETAIAYLRGFRVRLWIVLQDLTQIQRDYPKSWETFLGNAGFIQAFSVVDLTTQKYLSELIGKTTIQITNKQDVSSSQAMAGDTGLRRSFQAENLLNPDEIGRFFAHDTTDQGQNRGGLSLVKIAGKAPFIVDRVFHGEIEQ